MLAAFFFLLVTAVGLEAQGRYVAHVKKVMNVSSFNPSTSLE